MERIVEQGFLYDFYGSLLTKRQQEIYEAYVYEDLSLSELAERFDISRQAVHDQLKRCEKALEKYEEQLGMIERFRQQSKGLADMRELLLNKRNEKGELHLDRAESDKLLGMLTLLKEGS